MDLAQQTFNFEANEKQKQIREMVMESYGDIVLGKGRDCNEFFDELEKRYSSV